VGIGLVTLLLLWLSTPAAITLMTVIGMVGFVTVFARSRSLRRFN
jgi:Flp pilus assembly protein TadB